MLSANPHEPSYLESIVVVYLEFVNYVIPLHPKHLPLLSPVLGEALAEFG